MTTYPIALELTVWFDLGLNQYELAIDKTSKISIKRTDDVLHTRELLESEVAMVIEAINTIRVPVVEQSIPSGKASSSYELIIESAHFSLEFNWENLDIEASKSDAFDSVVRLASLVQGLDLDH
jgi:hypothetical protein